MPRVRLLVAVFFAGGSRCGYATSSYASLEANRRAAFSISHVTLSDEEHATICGLPVTITRVVLQLYERNRPAAALLSHEFDSTYTFIM